MPASKQTQESAKGWNGGRAIKVQIDSTQMPSFNISFWFDAFQKKSLRILFGIFILLLSPL